MFQFGSGAIFALPYGSFAAANPTPIQFGTLQDGSFDISGTMKELYGRNQFPDAVARAQVKLTGKAKAARMYAKQFNDVFFGQALAVGSSIPIIDEVGTIPGVSTYIVTVAHNATFQDDLGVRYSSTGVAFVKVASGPTIGQYSVSAGVYTFAAADANAGVLINYTYTSTTIGSSVTITNQPMGQQPTLILTLGNIYAPDGKGLKIKLWAAISTKITLSVKNEDFTIPEFDFTAFADSAGRVMSMDMGE